MIETFKETAERFISKIIKTPTCWIWDAGRTKTGYGQFGDHEDHRYAHQFSYELFKGPILDNKHVLHSCDNRWCVNPNHLRLGTALENSQDMSRKNRSMCGEKSNLAKLKQHQVVEILKYKNQGLTQKQVSARFNISRQTVGDIWRGKRWQRVYRSFQ